MADYRKYLTVCLSNGFCNSNCFRKDLLKFELTPAIEQIEEEYQSFLDYWEDDSHKDPIVYVETWIKKDGEKRLVLKEEWTDELNGGHRITKRHLIMVAKFLKEDGSLHKDVSIPIR